MIEKQNQKGKAPDTLAGSGAPRKTSQTFNWYLIIAASPANMQQGIFQGGDPA